MRKYGLIGKTLSHSFSKTFFEQKFAAEGIDASYENVEIPAIEEVTHVLAEGFSGLNVTIPYKQQIIPFLDALAPEAKAIGAVNTVVFNDGETIGHNTDAHGFHQSIKPFLTNKHERALILGTGGASLAVAYVLRNLGINVCFVSREKKGEGYFTYDQINVHMVNAFKLIVQCTPVGTFPNVDDCVPFPFEFLTEDHLCVDLIYNPSETAFLRQSKAHGATILNGESMLKEQALKAWELFNGELKM